MEKVHEFKLWKQIMVLSAEIDDNKWAPVAFGLLPSKTYASYYSFYKCLVDKCVEIGELQEGHSLPARYFMSVSIK